MSRHGQVIQPSHSYPQHFRLFFRHFFPGFWAADSLEGPLFGYFRFAWAKTFALAGTRQSARYIAKAVPTMLHIMTPNTHNGAAVFVGVGRHVNISQC